MQYVGAGFLFVGLIGLFERIWVEEGEVSSGEGIDGLTEEKGAVRGMDV